MFVGIVRTSAVPAHLDPAQLLDALCPFGRGDAQGSLVTDRLIAVQARLQITPESRREQLPYVDPDTGCVVLSWARLDNRQDLAREFGWTVERARDATEPEYLAAAWDRWRTDAANRIEGDFSFAVWDARTGEVYAARDAMGVRPLFYATGTGVFAVATSAAPFHAIPQVDSSPSRLWMARYIDGASSDFETTALEDVLRVPAGSWVHMRDGVVRCERYQEFGPSSPREDERDPRWLEAYRDLFLQTVSDRLRADDPIGAELSGGLDSSTIVAAIAHLRPESKGTMHTFGYAHAEQEPEYILETSRVLEIVHNHVFCGDWVVDGQERGWRTVGYPIEHGNSVSHIAIYELARMFGISVLFSGHGGDEGVTNNARDALDEMIARKQYRLAMETIGGRKALQPARLFKRMQEERADPNLGLREAVSGRLKYSPLKSEVFEEAEVAARVERGIAMHDLKPAVNDLALARLLAPLSPIRTSDGSIVAASYGIEYQWPLLDRRLIQQWLSTPTVWKQANGFGRYLHRAACASFTPKKVVWKQQKDMTGGAGYDLKPDPEATKAAWASVRARLTPSVEDLIDIDRLDAFVSNVDDDGDMPMRRRVRNVEVLSDWTASL